MPVSTSLGSAASNGRATLPALAELAERPQWVCWRTVQRGGKPKPDKVPVQPNGSATSAGEKHRDTWTTYEAVAAGDFSGVGFVFTREDPYVGIDLDDCIDPDTGELHPAAAEIVADLDTYAEISPSGRGVKLICRGVKLDGWWSKVENGLPWGGKAEMYDWGRYFTITGDAWPGATPEIRDCQDALQRTHDRIAAYKRSNGGEQSNGSAPAGDGRPDVRRVLLREFSKRGPRHDALLAVGRALVSLEQDEAVAYAAEAVEVANWLGGERDIELREAERTIRDGHGFARDKGLSGATAAATWEAPTVGSVPIERVEFLIPQRVPLRAVTLLAGDPGLGKSTLTTAWAAAVTAAGGEVLFASAEDGIAQVVAPRLLAAGADVELVRYFQLRDEDGPRGLEIPDDIASLSEAVTAHAAKLVVVDPINAHISGSIDSHRDHGIRRALAPLARLADERNCAVVAVAHFNKATSSDPLHRIVGSIGYVGAARSVLGFARDPEDDDDESDRRLLVHIKSNWSALAPTAAYDLERATATREGYTVDTTRLRFVEETDATAVDVFGSSSGRGGRKEDAMEAIAEQLATGPRASKEVKKAVMTAVECSEKTVKRAASQLESDGALTISEEGFPRRTMWALIRGAASSWVKAHHHNDPTGATGVTEPKSQSGHAQSGHEMSPPDPTGANDATVPKMGGPRSQLGQVPEGDPTGDDPTGEHPRSALCGNPSHRASDWRPEGADYLVCGVCHPAPSSKEAIA